MMAETKMRWLAAWLMSTTLACGSDDSALPVCSEQGTAYFDRLPIAEQHIGRVHPMGELDPPGDAIPNSQSGFSYADAEQDIAIVSPGDVWVTVIESTEWLESPTRQGLTDYSLVIQPCRDIKVNLHHILELEPALLETLNSAEPSCDEYAGVDETVRSCTVFGLEIPLASGQAIGRAGRGVTLGLDFDPGDQRVENYVASPDRYPKPHFDAICMHSLFVSDLAEYLYSVTGFMGEVRTAEPRCGTVEVDQPGTAAGVWVRADQADASLRDDISVIEHFLTLAPHFIHPDVSQSISPGMTELGARLWEVPTGGTGRVAVPFDQIAANGDIHCYEAMGDVPASFLIALDASDQLSVEMIEHVAGESPCAGDPSAWQLSPAALTFVR